MFEVDSFLANTNSMSIVQINYKKIAFYVSNSSVLWWEFPWALQQWDRGNDVIYS